MEGGKKILKRARGAGGLSARGTRRKKRGGGGGLKKAEKKPKSKPQKNTKSQAPKHYRESKFGLGIWKFFGAWCLDLGAFSGIHDRKRSIKNRQADDFRFGDVRAMGD